MNDLPHFCSCGADEYICQFCGGIFCSAEQPSVWVEEGSDLAVQMKKHGNMCPKCQQEHISAKGEISTEGTKAQKKTLKIEITCKIIGHLPEKDKQHITTDLANIIAKDIYGYDFSTDKSTVENWLLKLAKDEPITINFTEVKPMSCEQVRKIFVEPMSLKEMSKEQALRQSGACEHLLHCESCFKWSFEEAQKIKKGLGKETKLSEYAVSCPYCLTKTHHEIAERTEQGQESKWKCVKCGKVFA